ncbi:uncharacterized protein (TIGR00297 family) [Evansella vedderi]|uniref:Uncharacterized protein (TIGR00297 family) n=1 Tax=Evansella vedderi TaxID=38282 RepID=A0ABT9ZUM6_9BACI|nr:DUF92 domain-containing protein [Evansella vedderi]MDQ0254411.1 uncharacterized protein (TIGR00297 family) [Evansella vedderi]
MIIVLILGILLLAFFSYKVGALTLGGAITAVLVATIVLYGLSLFGLLLLAAFFLSSTLIGRLTKAHYSQEENSLVEKGSKREASQVLANGGWAAASAFLYGVSGQELWYWCYIATLAAATSDTWASEIGRMSKRKPIHVFSLRELFPGQSGGITYIGTIGAFAGSMFIVSIAWLLQFTLEVPNLSISIILVLILVGFLGNWVDTILGAWIQASYYCKKCGKETEKRIHCRERPILIKGYSFVNNDIVNHSCTLSAIGFVWLFRLFY